MWFVEHGLLLGVCVPDVGHTGRYHRQLAVLLSHWCVCVWGGGSVDKYDSWRVREGKWGGVVEGNHGREFYMATQGPLSRGNLNLDLKRGSQPGDLQG